MSGKLKKTFGIIFIILILTIALFRSIKKSFENPLKDIPQESSEIPSYVAYGSLYSDYGKIYVDGICRKNGYYCKEILCLRDGKVYFVDSDSDYWVIGELDLVTSEFRTCCKMADPAESYEIQGRKKYKDRNGYYFDGQIVLTDHKTVVTYDIDSQIVQMYAYSDYCFPECVIYGEAVDRETIRLNMGDSVRTYTLQEMAEKSDSIAQILELKEKKIWAGDSYLYRFFSSGNVQFIGDKVYTIGGCLNYHGQAYAVIFEHDVEEDSWKYVTNCFTGDRVSYNNCYVIPSE